MAGDCAPSLEQAIHREEVKGSDQYSCLNGCKGRNSGSRPYRRETRGDGSRARSKLRGGIVGIGRRDSSAVSGHRLGFYVDSCCGDLRGCGYQC